MGKPASVLAQQPSRCIFNERVLHRAGKNLVSMAHIHVEHLVLRVCPNDRNISVRQEALDP